MNTASVECWWEGSKMFSLHKLLWRIFSYFFLGKNAQKCHIITQDLWQTKRTCSQKEFLSIGRLRNLLGIWFTNAFCADSSEIICSFLQFEKYRADFHNCKNFCAGN
jgi:hypothetical protein